MKTPTLLLLGLWLFLAIGALLGYSYHEILPTIERPLSLPSFLPSEKLSPGDHIREDQIHIVNDKVEIDFEGKSVLWATFKDSNSMDPLLDVGAHSLEIVPASTNDINIGDIIAYRYGSKLIVHRVVEIGTDQDGWYAVTKGDNLVTPDPLKIRFSMIERLTVGVIY